MIFFGRWSERDAILAQVERALAVLRPPSAFRKPNT
jgi:hypothetical protein